MGVSWSLFELFGEDDSGLMRCEFEPMIQYMGCETPWLTMMETPAHPAG